MTPMLWAAYGGDVLGMELLICHGADIDAKDTVSNSLILSLLIIMYHVRCDAILCLCH